MLREGPAYRAHLATLSRQLELALGDGLPGLRIFGEKTERIPGTSMIAHPAMRAGWLRQLSRVACSAGSSCASGSSEPSHVLLAMGVERSLAAKALRLSLGQPSTPAEVEQIAEHLITTGQRLLG
jgi:cysteine desulfurase